MITTAASFVNVTIGSTATFTCTATGNPAPAITWSHDGQQLVTSGRYLISSDRRTLSVLNAQQDDDGVYMCHASSQVGSQSDSINLDVQGKELYFSINIYVTFKLIMHITYQHSLYQACFGIIIILAPKLV